jgi:hypothetical protein
VGEEYDFSVKNGSKRDIFNDTGIDRCVILKWVLKWEGVD